ncbi:hypothetical protein ECKIH15140_03608 [Escherichia coli O145:H28]|nr:hypothetical protein ECKIH15140_03608 [Escherichia coli O145:H28]
MIRDDKAEALEAQGLCDGLRQYEANMNIQIVVL